MRREGDDHGPPPGPGDRPEPVERRSGITPRQVLIGLLAIVLIAFGIANFDQVEVNFLLFQSQARLVTVIVVAAALGFVIGYFVGRPSRAERRFLRDRPREHD